MPRPKYPWYIILRMGDVKVWAKRENHNEDQQPTTNNQKPTTDNRQHISRHVSDASATTAATSPAQQQHLLHGSNSSNKCCISLSVDILYIQAAINRKTRRLRSSAYLTHLQTRLGNRAQTPETETNPRAKLTHTLWANLSWVDRGEIPAQDKGLSIEPAQHSASWQVLCGRVCFCRIHIVQGTEPGCLDKCRLHNGTHRGPNKGPAR